MDKNGLLQSSVTYDNVFSGEGEVMEDKWIDRVVLIIVAEAFIAFQVLMGFEIYHVVFK